ANPCKHIAGVYYLLASALDSDEEPLVEPVHSFYTPPVKEPISEVGSHKEFWTGAKRLPTPVASASQTSVPALLIKKQGDYPAFWHKDVSFISVMEELYERVRTKNKQMK
ncbi:MAG TPA: hypothetical protein VE843_06790, partial [Ktedonobacteraceae bacterium]|nr:hypothetical protein [Ktedonobacteraceae bacterium]